MDITEILFSILAIVSGIITTATFTIFTIFLLSKLFPNSYGTKVKTPSLFWVLLNLFYSCLFAILGGFVCGIIAGRGKEIIHSLVLGGVMIIGSIAEMVIPEKNLSGEKPSKPVQPKWYRYALLILGTPMVVIGGYLCKFVR